MLLCKKNIIITYLLTIVLLIANILAFQSADQLTGNASTVIICNSNPPNISAIPNQVATVGTLFSYQANASDPEGETIVYTDNSAFFDISNTGLISFTPVTGQEGSTELTIGATDVCSTATTKFTLLIQADPTAQQTTSRSGTSGRRELPQAPSIETAQPVIQKLPKRIITPAPSKPTFDSVSRTNKSVVPSEPSTEQPTTLITPPTLPQPLSRKINNAIFITSIIILIIICIILLLFLFWLYKKHKKRNTASVAVSIAPKQFTLLLLTATVFITVIGGNIALQSTLQTLAGSAVADGQVRYCVTHQPYVFPIADTSIFATATWQLQVIASDDDADTLTYLDDTSLFDINTTSGLISFTPSNDQTGVYAITITAKDICTNYTRTFGLTVKALPETSSAGGGGGGGGGGSSSSSSSSATNSSSIESPVTTSSSSQTTSTSISGYKEIIVAPVTNEQVQEVTLFLNSEATPEEKGSEKKSAVQVISHARKPSTVTTPPPRITYKYLEIKPQVASSKIASGIIKFSVDKSWAYKENIDEKKIALALYRSGQWEKLPTTLIGSGQKEYHYAATTQGFSYFAITGEKRTTNEPRAPETEAPATEEASEGVTAQETLAKIFRETTNAVAQQQKILTGIGIFVILTVVFVIGEIWLKHRKGRKK